MDEEHSQRNSKVRDFLEKFDKWLREKLSWLDKWFGEGTGNKLADILEVAGVVSLIIVLKKLWDWLKKIIRGNKDKTAALTEETAAVNDEAYAFNWALIPALGLAYEAVKKLIKGTDEEAESQGAWQRQTAPALGAIAAAYA